MTSPLPIPRPTAPRWRSRLEIKKSASYEIKVTGPAEDGIDHDLDLFYLWLNPLLTVSMDPQGNLRWGIAVDGPTMLVQYLYAGWLKNPSTMPANVASVLSSRGLTTTDFAQILAMDPFAAASTAIDPARFQPTARGCPTSRPTPRPTGGLKIANSLQWTNTSSFEGSAESSESASVTIGGPAFGYTGPTDVLVYWDTIFGSFMFAFATVAPAASGNFTDASGNPVTGQPLTLTAGGQPPPAGQPRRSGLSSRRVGDGGAGGLQPLVH